jgi:serine/threonine-protein kinase
VAAATSKLDFGQVVQSRDGRWLILRTAPASTGNPDIVGMNTNDTTLVPLVDTPAFEFFPSLSPDNRWIAYSSNESGQSEVYIRPFPETSTAKWQVSTAGGNEPVWARSGRELFYINGKGEMVSAEIRPGPPFTVGRQRALFSTTPFSRQGPVPSYSVGPDDTRFLMIREGDLAQQSELVVAENWTRLLTKAGK